MIPPRRANRACLANTPSQRLIVANALNVRPGVLTPMLAPLALKTVMSAKRMNSLKQGRQTASHLNCFSRVMIRRVKYQTLNDTT
jgi:hypothetical protein